MFIGQLLKDWRYINRVSLREISKHIDIDIATLSRLENGKEIDMSHALKIINSVFGPDYFVQAKQIKMKI
jgi:transcriptional regulator with XRE-family HTH domain